MINWLINLRLNAASKKHQKQLETMLSVISAHGLKAHKYFPGIGHRDNIELSTALDWFASEGFIITNSKGDIVGKVATANMDSTERAEWRRSQMQLVQKDSCDD